MTRDPAAVIAQERLMHETPQRVFDWLGRHGDKQFGWLPAPEDQDEELEVALLERNDPLIRLGLAQWCFSRRVAEALLDDALGQPLVAVGTHAPFPDGPMKDAPVVAMVSPLRVALFSNVHSRWLPYHFGYRSIVEHSPYEELLPLLSNPTFSQSDLRDLFERKGLFADLPDDRLQMLVRAAGSNPQLHTPYDGPDDDGVGQWLYYASIDAAFEMTLNVPATQWWAYALLQVCDQLAPPTFLKKGQLEDVISRWRIETVEERENATEYLTLPEELRKAIARLKVDRLLLIHEDRAVRCAAYEYLKWDIGPAEVASGVERDGRLFLFHALRNESLYFERATREALSDAAWRGRGAYDTTRKFFQQMEARLREKNPEWFVEDTTEVDRRSKEAKEAIEQRWKEEVAHGVTQTLTMVQNMDLRTDYLVKLQVLMLIGLAVLIVARLI